MYRRELIHDHTSHAETCHLLFPRSLTPIGDVSERLARFVLVVHTLVQELQIGCISPAVEQGRCFPQFPYLNGEAKLVQTRNKHYLSSNGMQIFAIVSQFGRDSHVVLSRLGDELRATEAVELTSGHSAC